MGGPPRSPRTESTHEKLFPGTYALRALSVYVASARSSRRWSSPSSGAANITAVYPFVEVVFRGQSLQQWVDRSIDKSQAVIVEQTATVEQLRQQAAKAEEDTALRSELSRAQASLEAEQLALWRYEYIKPYIDDYLPDDPFRTLVWSSWRCCCCGTIVKDVFLIANSVLVDAAGAAGHVRPAQAVLSPHAADGPGHLQRRRHHRPDEPLHVRHGQRGRRASSRSSASWSASR